MPPKGVPPLLLMVKAVMAVSAGNADARVLAHCCCSVICRSGIDRCTRQALGILPIQAERNLLQVSYLYNSCSKAVGRISKNLGGKIRKRLCNVKNYRGANPIGLAPWSRRSGLSGSRGSGRFAGLAYSAEGVAHVCTRTRASPQ